MIISTVNDFWNTVLLDFVIYWFMFICTLCVFLFLPSLQCLFHIGFAQQAVPVGKGRLCQRLTVSVCWISPLGRPDRCSRSPEHAWVNFSTSVLQWINLSAGVYQKFSPMICLSVSAGGFFFSILYHTHQTCMLT